MARVSKRKVKGKKVESNRMDEPFRREFEDSLGEIDILGQDYSVAHILRTMHPFELKMRYLRYLEDRDSDMGTF